MLMIPVTNGSVQWYISVYLQIVQLDCRNQSHLATMYFFPRVPPQLQTPLPAIKTPVIKILPNWSSLHSLIFGKEPKSCLLPNSAPSNTCSMGMSDRYANF